MRDISIIITAYNYEDYIEECIESCLNQDTSCNYEIIIVDDGSTDNTGSLISKYQSEQVKVYSIKNGGIEKASNFGIKKSAGKYIVRVDADDKLEKQYIETVYHEIKNSDADFVYSNYRILDQNSRITEEITLPSFDVDEIRQRGDFQATGTLFKKNALEAVGFFSEETPNCGLENYELILKLLEWGAKGNHVEQFLFYYRRHNSNFSELKRKKIIDYGQKLSDRFDLGTYSTNENHPYKLKV